jgi:hypothetical protein
MPDVRYVFLELDRCAQEVFELLRSDEELTPDELLRVRKVVGQLLLGLQDREGDSL